MRRCRIKLGKSDVLYVTLHHSYIHFHLIQPGQARYTTDLYIPRRKFVALLKWVVRSYPSVPHRADHYVPDAVKRQLALEEEYQTMMRQQKRARRGKRKRYS